jgi:hypothetical protein
MVSPMTLASEATTFTWRQRSLAFSRAGSLRAHFTAMAVGLTRIHWRGAVMGKKARKETYPRPVQYRARQAAVSLRFRSVRVGASVTTN